MRALNRDEQEQRKRKVLQSVIHHFIRTGKPVGSNSIVGTASLGFSSATIRNILSELEKEDFITHPHTSAGRVPTDKGYRCYVDSIIELQRLAVQEEHRIQKEYESRMREIEDLMSQTSKMLSSISHYTGFVVAPKLDKNLFSNLELVPLSKHKILVAMITQTGLTKHFIINTVTEIPKETLRKISRSINKNLQNCTLEEAQIKMVERLEDAQIHYQEMMSLGKEIAQEIKNLSSGKLYLDGANNILSLPDFSKTDDLLDFFKIIEEKQMLSNILENEILESPDKRLSFKMHSKEKKDKKGKSPRREQKVSGDSGSSQVHVRIGSENSSKAMRNISVVSSTYELADRTVGVLGILGPKRMEYPKMIALVDYISQTVNRVLKQIEGE